MWVVVRWGVTEQWVSGEFFHKVICALFCRLLYLRSFLPVSSSYWVWGIYSAYSLLCFWKIKASFWEHSTYSQREKVKQYIWFFLANLAVDLQGKENIKVQPLSSELPEWNRLRGQTRLGYTVLQNPSPFTLLRQKPSGHSALPQPLWVLGMILSFTIPRYGLS